MPIESPFDIEPISQSQFHEIDHLVMRHAFDVQNELGRLCNESIYHAEIIHRCEQSGLGVISEGEIVASLDSFRKSYYVDAVISPGAVYEFKAVSALNGGHESQLLNYLFLLGVLHGKLINFSSPSVQYRFVSTAIDFKKRFMFSVDEGEWDAKTSADQTLREIVLRLLSEWGAFLDISLYREAVIYFLGGEEALMHPVEVCVAGRSPGCQKMYLLDDVTGLHISSIIRHEQAYRQQLDRLLSHTALQQMQWVNFNRETIQLITLKK